MRTLPQTPVRRQLSGCMRQLRFLNSQFINTKRNAIRFSGDTIQTIVRILLYVPFGRSRSKFELSNDPRVSILSIYRLRGSPHTRTRAARVRTARLTSVHHTGLPACLIEDRRLSYSPYKWSCKTQAWEALSFLMTARLRSASFRGSIPTMSVEEEKRSFPSSSNSAIEKDRASVEEKEVKELFTPEPAVTIDEKKLVRKIDLALIPWLSFLYLICELQTTFLS